MKEGEELFKPLEDIVKVSPYEDPVFLMPGSKDAEMQRRVFEAYIMSFKSLDVVAAECGADARIVLRWAKQGDWAKRRADLEKLHVKDLDNATRIFAAEQRQAASMNMLRAGQKISSLLERKIDQFERGDEVTAGQLKMMAESLIAASTVTSRAVGLSDTGQMPESEDEKVNKGKVPLVTVNLHSAVRVSEKPVIDVTVDEG